jgi:two-component system, OmpR family, osmolarity sensor histidine kinase EnvZ
MVSLMPRTITFRIVVLIMLILLANVLLTWIFSIQYAKKMEMKETVQGLRAIVSDLNANENLIGISDLLDDYHIIERKTPPENLRPAHFPMLHNMADRFNQANEATIEFYNSLSEPGYVWLYYYYGPHNFDMWLGIPKHAFVEGAPYVAFTQEFIIVFLVIAGSLIVASSIRKPLRDISAATLKFGTGEIPEHIKEVGPEEVIQVARSFNRMVDDFKNLQRERELMLAGISHDLRTPLTRLQLTVDLTREIDERTREDLKSDIRQITAMQQQFIDYISAGGNEAFSHVNMNDLIGQALTKFEHECKEPILFEHPDGIIFSDVAPISIGRVVNNLVTNAIKYGATPIKVVLSQDQNHTILSVIDQGEGVPPEQEEDIFRPLYRGDVARKNAQGSGLGLAIVQRIVNKHHGKISVHQSQGFEIRITLPRSVN